MIATTYKSVRRERMTEVTPPVVADVTPPAAAPPATPPVENSVPYSRFKEVNDAHKALEKQIAELTTKATSADDLTAQVASLNARILRTNVALAKGIPAELHDLLVGKDEAELNAAADKLLKFVKTAPAPNIDASTPTTAKPTFTIAQLTDSKFFKENEAAILLAQREGRIVA